jgi:hypothetical protein
MPSPSSVLKRKKSKKPARSKDQAEWAMLSTRFMLISCLAYSSNAED